jgi:hypothetical protein
MTDQHTEVVGPLPVTARSVPLGISCLPEAGLGVDLAAHRYVEEEYLVTGLASTWTYDDSWRAVVDVPDVAYTTRIMVRRPSNSSSFSGVVHVEPLHPSFDRALTWRTAAPLILREGHAWVGITQHHAAAAMLRDQFSAERYARISVPMPGLGWEMVGAIGQLLRSPGSGNPLGDLPVRQAYLSGWSFTGTFCRVFLQEGFHQRHRQPDGRPVFDGYLIGISSGSAGRGGYHPLSEPCPLLPAGDPRRTIQPADVPVIEFMSEFESETNRRSLRPDSDEPDDRYRLYQVAGSAHASAVDMSIEQIQLAAGDLPEPPRIREMPVSNRNRHRAARSAYRHLHRWAAESVAPPRADRLELMMAESGGLRGLSAEAEPLRRDEHDNAVRGVRSTWADLPVASYLPHSTPGPGPDTERGWRPPGLGRAASADLTGHQIPFPPAKLSRLYGTHGEYLARVRARAVELVRDGWLLLPDADDLIAEAADSAHRWDGEWPEPDSPTGR